METNTILLIGGGVTGAILTLGFLLRELTPTTEEDRLAVLTGQKAATGTSTKSTGGVVKRELIEEGMSGLRSSIGRAAEGVGNVRLFFEQANSPITFDVFLIISAAMGVLGFGLGLLTKAPYLLLPIVSLVCALLPYFWLSRRRAKRMKMCAKQMPDAMELIARALRSGHALTSGLHVVVEEMPDPISTEFSIAYEQQNLGIPIEKALKSMMMRMPNLDLKFFVTAVAIQRQAGGDLAEILDKIGYVVRERFKLLGMVQALTGEGRISGIVLMALPILLFFGVYYVNPEYVTLLFVNPMGRQMMIGALVLQVLGAYSIKKIIDIKV
jgi:tight adherence protein B